MKTHGIASLTACLCLAAGLMSLSPASAQQALPFERGVKIDVIASKPAAVKGGDFDDKLQRITLRLKFSNLDTRQSYANYTATVSAFGQSAKDRTVTKVLLQESIPLTVEPRKAVEHECKAVKTKFDRTGAIFGYSYDGWIIVVKDSTGKIVQVKSTAPSLEKLPDKVDKLAEGKCYDRKLEPTDDPDDR
ncbi:hypothetical protein [Roseimicrobium sp. ORNL1]|uniref:hypothetical protein n=1 Tax=Roseimicrobium sp. ORNL1 TaxID=2711231 RepID=UPI0013E16C9D|nr:hypothetical protein [Roseimicrobium sp. ORNL1]QIF03770.1 hypothetical protein G5S37_20345 [Roseimicrobium sp. ORNL1]